MDETKCRRDSGSSPRLRGTFRQFVAVWNESQGYETPTLHLTMGDWLERCLREGRTDLLMMVFRDAGKSTLVGLYCAWRLCCAPDLRILVVAAEQRLACLMTRNIRSILENHPMASHIGLGKNAEWAADRFTIERQSVLRDPSVVGKGINGNLTGSRADLVICDDVEVPNTAGTRLKRADLRRKLGELRFILVPGGTRLYIGTPHTHDSIYLDKPDASAGRNRSSEGNKAFLGHFTRLEIPVIDEQGISAWPERFPIETLVRMQEETGPARFRSQMMLMPEILEDCRLDPKRLLSYDQEIDVRRSHGRLVLEIGGQRMVGACCWWDPSYGRPSGGDSSVVACVFTDEVGHYWLHDIAYLTFDPSLVSQIDEASQLCRKVVDFARRNEQYSVTVENNGIGQFLPSLLRREAGRAGHWLSVHGHRSNRPKVTRILEAFDPVLAAGHLHVHERVMASPFLEELREWTTAGACADDGLDAVSGCLSMQPVRTGQLDPQLQKPDWRGFAGAERIQSDFAVF
ncbi:MAG: phage terminase large subunit [Geminicoccaceae bacterium]